MIGGGLAVPEPAAAETGQAAGPDLRIGTITVVTDDIFSAEEVAAVGGAERLLRRAMNGLKVGTREKILRRELLLAEDEPYDPGDLAETERNLRRLGFLNNVTVTATDTTADGRVNVLVKARESWTLSTSFDFSFASSGDTRWNARASEINFLGYGVTIGAGVGQDEDRNYWNLWYRKRRLFDTGLWFGLDFAERADGHHVGATLARPFYALDDPWSFHAEAWESESEIRTYLSNAGAAGLDRSREVSLYGRIPRVAQHALLQVHRRLGAPSDGRVWRAGAGVRVLETDYRPEPVTELSDGRLVDLVWTTRGREVLARDAGREVFPHLSLWTEGRSWTKRRFVLQYGPVEDIPLHGELALTVGPVGGGVGSTTSFGQSAWRSELVASWWRPAGGGLLLASLAATGVAGDHDVRSHAATAVAGWIVGRGPAEAPWLTRVFVEGGHASRLNGTTALVLGLDRGLRTLDFDGMAGDRLVRWNLEQGKVFPGEFFGLFRAGLAAFYGAGTAWWRDEDRGPADARHEVGVGLRIGPTRSANARIARFDLAWPLDGSGGAVLTAASGGHF